MQWNKFLKYPNTYKITIVTHIKYLRVYMNLICYLFIDYKNQSCKKIDYSQFSIKSMQ